MSHELFIKNFQLSPKIVFGKLRMIEIGPGCAEKGHPFFRCPILAKKYASKS
jgi:hypothetical protein